MTLSLDKNTWFVNPSGSTDGNLVTPLIDGVVCFSHIEAQLNTVMFLGTGGFCYYAAWEMTPNFHLSVGGSDSISDKFIHARSAGLGVRILLFQNWGSSWDNHLELKRRMENSTYPIEVLMDRKHQSLGSHHQKLCIIGRLDPADSKYTLVAFCGGIDPATDRFDDIFHRPTESIDYHLGWHDVHARVEGPAAEQLLQTFIDRWNDHAHPLTSSKYNTDTTAIGPRSVKLPQLQNNTQQVEVLHTYSCLPTKLVDGNEVPQPEWGYSFAGDGIQTIKQAYLKAISQAQHYIYIENQYFAEMEIINALIAKLNAGVTVIAVTPYFMNVGYDNLRLDAWRLFQQSPNKDNFHLCDLRHPDAGYSSINPFYPDSNYSEPIYVHVKLMIVDDVYALIGSANLNLRSMVSDSELAIAVLDTQTETDDVLQTDVCKFARDLRIALFNEHLEATIGSTPFERSIQAGLSMFTANINDPVGVVMHSPSRVFKHNPENIWFFGAKRLMSGPAEQVPRCFSVEMEEPLPR